MNLLDVLRKVMELDVDYTIDELNNLLTKNNLGHTVTLEILSNLPDKEFSVMTIKKDEDITTFIRRKGQTVVKLPPNVPH